MLRKQILFCVLVLPLVVIHAQVPDYYFDKVKSNFGISGEIGYATNPNLLFGKQDIHTPYGIGGGAAFFYELQYEHLLFRTGFGVDLNRWKQNLADQHYSTSVKEYSTMQLHYDMSSLTETQNYGVGYIPILLGGTFNGFFFLAGAKIGVLSFMNEATTQSNVTIWATDLDLIDPMSDMRTHSLGNISVNNKQSIDFAPMNIMASAELGIDFDQWLIPQPKRLRRQYYIKSMQERTHLRLSFFVDYGFSNLHKYVPNAVPINRSGSVEENGGMFRFDDVNQLNANSWTGYKPYSEQKLNNLLAGVKLAVMFELPMKKPKRKPSNYAPIITYVQDTITMAPIVGANVKITNIAKNRVTTRTTDKRRGRVYAKMAPGSYSIEVTKEKYLPSQPVFVEHKDDDDTLIINLFPLQTLRAQTVDKHTGRPVWAEVFVYNEANEMVAHAQLDSVTNTLSALLDGHLHYRVCASANGYIDTCEQVTNITDLKVLQLSPKVIRRFVLKNMFFATNQTKILATSEQALQELYRLLNENTDIRIRIIGHTDDVGSDASNQVLSEGRSSSIKREMVKRGIDAGRIETIGHGEKDPIVANDSDEHRQMNRRVEIEIIDGSLLNLNIQNEQLAR